MNQFVIDAWGQYAYSNLTNYFGDQKNHSYSLSAIVSYSTRHGSFRNEIGFTQFHLSSYYDGRNDSNATGVQGNLIKADTIKQKMFWLSTGFSWRIITTNRVSLYSGVNVNALVYSPSIWRDNLRSNNSPDYDRWEGSTPGGYAIGPGACDANSYFGTRAGLLGSSNTGNSIFGWEAGYNNTADENSFFGEKAGRSNTSGTQNCLFGPFAGYANATGSYNTIMGYQAGYGSSGNSSANSFFGFQAGYSVTSSGSNVFISNLIQQWLRCRPRSKILQTFA